MLIIIIILIYTIRYSNEDAPLSITNVHSYIIIRKFIHSSMALQPFVEPWPHNPFYTDGKDSLGE
jgi:hypothetical protein